MFSRGSAILMSSSVDPGNIQVPRPYDALAGDCRDAAAQAMRAQGRRMPLSERSTDPAARRRLQRERRRQLESFLWIEPNPQALSRMADLIDEICAEGAWSAETALDDPFRPIIDLQAAETGALMAWTLRRHASRLAELSPALPALMLSEVRRRLTAPILAHEDYPFMAARGACPALIACDLLLCLLLMEKAPARRQGAVKLLLQTLDRICGLRSRELAPLSERLADACAVADLARLIKRLTRGELDLTRDYPPESWMDDVLIPWIGGEYFIDPSGEGMRPALSGMDLFRLGYFTYDRALSALGAQLRCRADRPGFSLTGRILSMEYMRAAEDERAAPPRLKRAASDSGMVMISRVDSLFAAITGGGGRANAGDICLFADGLPILVDAGGDIHSLPLVDGVAPRTILQTPPATDADFNEERDILTADLSGIYPDNAMPAAYQRTLMTLRRDGTVRLVDAFEFIQPPQVLTFRFVTALRPEIGADGVRLGTVLLSWDGDMAAEAAPLGSAAFPDAHLLSFRMTNPTRRLICGFTFELI